MLENIKSKFEENIKLHQDSMNMLAPLIAKGSELIIDAYKKGNKVLLCGNGGSAADAQHMAAELVGRFEKERDALPAIALTTDTSILTAISNDYGYEFSFSRQIEALGKRGDILIVISTSGNSVNIIKAVEEANSRGLLVVGLLGRDGGKLEKIVNLPIVIPSESTARIQEIHILIGHIICSTVEKKLFQ